MLTSQKRCGCIIITAALMRMIHTISRTVAPGDSKKKKNRIRSDSGKIQLLLDLCVLQALFGFPAIFRRDINTDIPSL